MPRNVQRSPEERRAIVQRMVADSGGKAPKGIALIDFREGTPAEFAQARALQGRALEALRKGARRKVKAADAAA